MLLKFRWLLEKHQQTKAVFDPINLHLMHRGLLMCEDSSVDVTVITGPSPTKNGSGGRDSEMHQTKKKLIVFLDSGVYQRRCRLGR